MGKNEMNMDERVQEVVAAWAELGRELNVSLVGLMDLPEKRAMGRMCMAVSALRECEMGNVKCEMVEVVAYAADGEPAQVVMRAEGAE